MSVIGSALPFFFGASKSSGLAIGDAYQGGFFAGYISHTANGVATHLLIVAPAASGYNGGTGLALKTSNTSTAGTNNAFNGSVNSANMNNASHPAAQYCEGLTIGGYSDWYLPARYELEIAYYNLKPTTTSNDTGSGINSYSVPARNSNYTAGTPAQTTVNAFKTGNSQAFIDNWHWSSTEGPSGTGGYIQRFDSGQIGAFNDIKTDLYKVRAFRKVAL